MDRVEIEHEVRRLEHARQCTSRERNVIDGEHCPDLLQRQCRPRFPRCEAILLQEIDLVGTGCPGWIRERPADRDARTELEEQPTAAGPEHPPPSPFSPPPSLL